MNLNALSLFVSVVQDGSLSKASERLNVPIATISRQITELEKSLNIQLFDRKKSGVKPTMAGQKLYEQVYQNIDNLLQVEKHSLNIKKLAEHYAFPPLQDWKKFGRGLMNLARNIPK